MANTCKNPAPLQNLKTSKRQNVKTHNPYHLTPQASNPATKKLRDIRNLSEIGTQQEWHPALQKNPRRGA
ncbi:MAG: hypothetical protein WC111_10685, partial [Candidatus Cloacimonadaceae bacterium]